MRNGGESELKMRGYKECEGQSRAEQGGGLRDVLRSHTCGLGTGSKCERPSPRNTCAKLSVLVHLILLASQRVKSLKTQGLA